MYYVIREKASNQYVKHLSFGDGGIRMTFTSDLGMAARISMREVAHHIAACVPSGSVKPLKGRVEDHPKPEGGAQ